MPTVTNSCDEEEWQQNGSQNLHKYPWCTTLSYTHGYFCSFFIELNTLASGTMTSGAQLSESEWQSDCELLSTLPLFALFTCWMSFEAVLGNKEFEFVVSEVTLTVVTRHSASRHGVSVLVSVTGRVHLIPLFKNSLKKSKSGNSIVLLFISYFISIHMKKNHSNQGSHYQIRGRSDFSLSGRQQREVNCD
jgi:hypothetical protein